MEDIKEHEIMPWVEKYRPKKLDEIVLNDINKNIIYNMIKKNNYKNMIFYGPPGTGKTTTILCLIKEYQKKYNCNNNYMHLNASHQRGIDVIRSQIYEFTKNKNFFNNHRKFVLLDEIDSMTKQAQYNLYYIIQKSKDMNITFILICNYLNKIIDVIRNTLLILQFNKTTLLSDSFIKKCIKNENIKISKKELNIIKQNNIHDLRTIINILQNYNNNHNNFLLSNTIFEKILTQQNYKNKMFEYLQNIDVYSFCCSFFLYIYNHYDLTDEEYRIMKYILIENNDENYLIQEFIPMIRNKIKIDC